MLCAVLFIVSVLMGLGKQTLRKQEYIEFLWPKNIYNTKFSVETCLEHAFALEYTCFQ